MPCHSKYHTWSLKWSYVYFVSFLWAPGEPVYSHLVSLSLENSHQFSPPADLVWIWFLSWSLYLEDSYTDEKNHSKNEKKTWTIMWPFKNVRQKQNLYLNYIFLTGLLLQLEAWKLLKIYSRALSPSKPYQALTKFANKMKQFGFKNFHFLAIPLLPVSWPKVGTSAFRGPAHNAHSLILRSLNSRLKPSF